MKNYNYINNLEIGDILFCNKNNIQYNIVHIWKYSNSNIVEKILIEDPNSNSRMWINVIELCNDFWDKKQIRTQKLLSIEKKL